MSKKSDFTNGMLRAGRNSGGSKKTLHDRDSMLRAYCQWLWGVGYQLTSAQGIRVRHVVEYISTRLADGVGCRTLQNVAAAIRSALRGAGRNVFASSHEISNTTLGIGGTSRLGTKRPITDLEYQAIYERAMALDAGLAAVLGLERWLGLRAREAIMAIQSLADWLKFLATGATKIKIIHGTKGGRVRDTTLHCREEAVKAIQFADEVAKKRGGVLIAVETLEAALGYYHRHVRDIGLRGEIAPHCLRYTFACDAVASYMRMGHSEREAHALAAMDLGHGSGRGRLIREIYGRMPKQGG